MTRYCPVCGAVVPKNSLTCPQCYTEVPRDDMEDEPRPSYTRRSEGRTRDQFREQITRRHKSQKLAMLLAIVPAFFGVLGLGLIYEDRRDSQGWVFLVAGLILFWVLVALIVSMHVTGILTTILLAIPMVLFALLYIGAAASSIAATVFGSYRFFGLRY